MASLLALGACGNDGGVGSGESTAASSEGSATSTGVTTFEPGATSVADGTAGSTTGATTAGTTTGATTGGSTQGEVTTGGSSTTGGETSTSGGTTSGGTTTSGTTDGGTTSGGTTTGGTTGGGPGCGNGAIDPGEQCDGLDLQGFDCASLGLGGGVLACDPITCTFDTSMCVPMGNCGNGVIDPGEQCDGLDLQGFDCASLGLGGGVLACDPMMCTFDTSMCMPAGGTSG
ncbi:hypothetical protein [Paraliomyxa miuraensis]|uniref:hypothetical protein n=1 Tax=Paraliomyxa miuraensis TaxID=376150 RepID=UPI002253DFDF|nr:hypothetical protein [Paraliomyxa miuraensis]MCX4241954.1 hypothetical protein [Paraliomyxa miuraensis]